MNSPRCVLPMSNRDEIMKSKIMMARFIPAIMNPMNVSQFLDDGGSFILFGFKWSAEVKLEKNHYK